MGVLSRFSLLPDTYHLTPGRRGQSVFEVALAIIVFIAACLGVQRFLKVGLMGRWKTIADAYGFGRQYDPKATKVK